MDLGLLWYLELAPSKVTDVSWHTSGGMGVPVPLVRSWIPEDAASYLMSLRPDLPHALRLDAHLTAGQSEQALSMWHGMSWRDRFLLPFSRF